MCLGTLVDFLRFNARNCAIVVFFYVRFYSATNQKYIRDINNTFVRVQENEDVFFSLCYIEKAYHSAKINIYENVCCTIFYDYYFCLILQM